MFSKPLNLLILERGERREKVLDPRGDCKCKKYISDMMEMTTRAWRYPGDSPRCCAWSRASVIAGLMRLPHLGRIRSNYTLGKCLPTAGVRTLVTWKEQLFPETKPCLIPGSARVTAREQRCSVSLGLISSIRLLKFAKVHYINERYPRSNHTGHASADLSLFVFFFPSSLSNLLPIYTFMVCSLT